MDLWKKDLRRRLLVVRAGYDELARAAAAAALADRVLALPELAGVAVVAAYVGWGDEPPTLPLLDALAGSGREVLLPLVAAGDRLAWAGYGGAGSLRPGRYGIPAPDPGAPRRELAEAGLVLVPGVGFDPAGGRLGRGGGYYDRALAEAGPGVPLVGLAYDECVVPAVPRGDRDVAVTVVVTPTRVLRPPRGG